MPTIFYKLLPDFTFSPVENADNAQIAHSLFRTVIGNVYISTIFLGIDHGWHNVEGPILFETMVFVHDGCGSEFDGYHERYSTYEAAKAGHEKMVQKIRDCTIP